MSSAWHFDCIILRQCKRLKHWISCKRKEVKGFKVHFDLRFLLMKHDRFKEQDCRGHLTTF